MAHTFTLVHCCCCCCIRHCSASKLLEGVIRDDLWEVCRQQSLCSRLAANLFDCSLICRKQMKLTYRSSLWEQQCSAGIQCATYVISLSNCIRCHTDIYTYICLPGCLSPRFRELDVVKWWSWMSYGLQVVGEVHQTKLG